MLKKQNHVGRPTNEELASKKRKELLKVLLPLGGIIVFIVIAVIAINGGLSSLMGNAVFGCEGSDVLKKIDNKYVCERTISARLLGDVNGDAKVNVSDVTAIQKYSAGMLSLDDISFVAADVDRDNVVTVKDATTIQKFLDGINPSTGGTNSANPLINEIYVCPNEYTLSGTNCIYTYDAIKRATANDATGSNATSSNATNSNVSNSQNTDNNIINHYILNDDLQLELNDPWNQVYKKNDLLRVSATFSNPTNKTYYYKWKAVTKNKLEDQNEKWDNTGSCNMVMDKVTTNTAFRLTDNVTTVYLFLYEDSKCSDRNYIGFVSTVPYEI